jgi:hypothetical protein
MRLQLSAHHMRRLPETGDNLPYFRSVFEQITVASWMVPVGALFLILAVALTSFIGTARKSTRQHSSYKPQVNNAFSECDLPDFDSQIFATKLRTRQQESKTIHQIPTSVEESMDSGGTVCLNRCRRLLSTSSKIDEISSRSTKARIRFVNQVRDLFEAKNRSSLHLAMNALREGQPLLAPPSTFSASIRPLFTSSGTQPSKNLI